MKNSQLFMPLRAGAFVVSILADTTISNPNDITQTKMKS